MCCHQERRKGQGAFAIRTVSKRNRRKNGYAYGIGVVFSDASFPDALILNIQTREVITYKTREGVQRRLVTLPAMVPFCSRCGAVEVQSFLTDLGRFRFTLSSDSIGTRLLPAPD